MSERKKKVSASSAAVSARASRNNFFLLLSLRVLNFVSSWLSEWIRVAAAAASSGKSLYYDFCE